MKEDILGLVDLATPLYPDGNMPFSLVDINALPQHIIVTEYSPANVPRRRGKRKGVGSENRKRRGAKG